MSTRPARLEDSEFAFAVKKTALGPYVEQMWGWDEAEQRALHARRFDPALFEIIQHGAEDVGLLALVRASDEWVLNQFYLLPSHQSRGIGGLCMNHMQSDAQAAGVRIRLQVLKVNLRAAAFYERYGFVRVAESETHVQMLWRPGH